MQQTIRSGFPRDANAVFPQKTINNVLEHFGPDRIIIVCDETDMPRDKAVKLVEAFANQVPADLFELDNGQLVQWSHENHADDCN